MPKSRALPVRTILLVMIGVVFLPMALFAAATLVRYADSERIRAEQQILESGAAIARAVDTEFRSAEERLKLLAASDSLTRDDLAAFERRLRQITAETGRYYALIDLDRQHLINTFLPPGAPLPKAHADIWRRVVEEGQTDISPVIRGSGSGEILTGVAVPVERDGAVKWILATRLAARDFRPLLASPGVSPDWIISIVDRDATILARLPKGDNFAGGKLTPRLLDYWRNGESGVVEVTSLEGVRNLAAVIRAPDSGWGIGIGIPTSQLEMPLRDALKNLLAGWLAVGLVALALAYLTARRVARSLLAVSDAARAIAANRPAAVPTSHIREIDALGAALTTVAERLRQHAARLEAEVQQRTEQLTVEMLKRESTEARIHQMQKMEAVGQLTGGIAHDFNNLLQGLSGCLAMIRRKPQDPERVREWAEAGLASVSRGAKLTGQLLTFSREQRLELRPIPLDELVDGMRELLSRTLGPMVRLRFDLGDGAVPVLSDATQLEMAVLNLAINARDAMPNGGDLTISAKRRRIDDDPELEPGEYVELAVSDTGTGMAPEVAARAFEPFFTTKGVGKGTGLGLSQVYGLARQSGGTVRIESSPGLGTTVRLLLRRSESGAASEHAAAVPILSPNGGTGASVLVVDDDPDVRRFLAVSLETAGYRAIMADGGKTALAELDRRAVDVMVLDYAMPDMTGAEVARAVRARRHDLPIVFISGYAETDAITDVAADVPILRKPFRLEDVEAAIAAALRRA